MCFSSALGLQNPPYPLKCKESWFFAVMQMMHVKGNYLQTVWITVECTFIFCFSINHLAHEKTSYYCKGWFFFPLTLRIKHNVKLARKIFFCKASTWVLRPDFQVWLKLGIPKVRGKPRHIKRKNISSPWDPSETPSLQSGWFHILYKNLYLWYLYSNFTYLTEKKREKRKRKGVLQPYIMIVRSTKNTIHD